MPVTYENARRMALALPGVEEGMAYGTPAFRVAGRFLFRIREDGALAVRIGFEEREALLAADRTQPVPCRRRPSQRGAPSSRKLRPS